MFPVGPLELVLHVEEPHPRSARNEHQRQVHGQQGLPAERPGERYARECQGEVVPQRARPLPPPGQGQVEREAVLGGELVERTDAEQDVPWWIA